MSSSWSSRTVRTPYPPRRLARVVPHGPAPTIATSVVRSTGALRPFRSGLPWQQLDEEGDGICQHVVPGVQPAGHPAFAPVDPVEGGLDAELDADGGDLPVVDRQEGGAGRGASLAGQDPEQVV